MPKANNTIVSHTSIYMFGDILRRSVSLIMLPIYTRYLTPEDYGIVELLSMLIDFASIIFGARVGHAVFRYYCMSESMDDKRSVIASALLLSAAMSLLGVAVISMLSGHIAVHVFSDPSIDYLIVLFAFTMLLEPFIQIPLTHIRADQRPWLFFSFNLMKLILQLSLNIYFVVILELHVEGVVLSAVISGAVMGVILSLYSLRRVGFSANISTCRTLFNFSLPLKLATIGSFYLAFGDRYILNMYTNLTEVGIYALGYKFGFIFLILTWDPFQKMWDAEKYNIYRNDNAKEIYQQVFLYVSIFLIFSGLSISLLTKDLLQIMSDPAFLRAHEIVPIIIIAYIFQAWTKYCSFGILIKEKTMQIAYGELIGVLVITIAYFVLIPKYGIYGAAWATLVGFAARFYWTDSLARKSYNMMLPWGKIWQTMSLAVAIFLLSFFVPDDLILSILFRLLLIAGFIALFILLPIMTADEKKAAWIKISQVRRSIVK